MATVNRSIYLAGGGTFNAVLGGGNTLFVTASNQYAILVLTSANASSVTLVGGVDGSPAVSGQNTTVYVPPSITVTGVDLSNLAASWVLYQTT